MSNIFDSLPNPLEPLSRVVKIPGFSDGNTLPGTPTKPTPLLSYGRPRRPGQQPTILGGQPDKPAGVNLDSYSGKTLG